MKETQRFVTDEETVEKLEELTERARSGKRVRFVLLTVEEDESEEGVVLYRVGMTVIQTIWGAYGGI